MRHKVEEAVRVYLVLSEDGTRWEVDLPTMDGYALDSDYDGGPTTEDCGCDDPAGCELARLEAARVPLPNGLELTALLAEAAAS